MQVVCAHGPPLHAERQCMWSGIAGPDCQSVCVCRSALDYMQCNLSLKSYLKWCNGTPFQWSIIQHWCIDIRVAVSNRHHVRQLRLSSMQAVVHLVQ
jgi:hypothetical protein